MDTHSDLKTLFDAWGIEFDPTKVVGDLTGAWRVRAGGDRVQAVNYVAWFNIRGGLNHDDPATADLQQVTVASSGYLAKAPNATIDFTPLLTTSDRSGVMSVDEVKMPDPAKVLADFKPEGGPRVIAARVHGVLKSAFSGPPPLVGEQKRPDNFPEHKAQTDGPANMVVVADSDILADRYWVRVADFFGQPTATPFSDNGPFVANLIGTLAGGDALIGLRSRGDTNRPFTLVSRMQSEAEAQFRQTRADAAEAPGRRGEAASYVALRRPRGEWRRGGRQCQSRCRDHPRSTRRYRRRSAGRDRDAAEAAGRAVGAEPRHLASRDRDAGFHHRAGAGAVDGAGDRHGDIAATAACEGPPMRARCCRGAGRAGCARRRRWLVFRHRHNADRADHDRVRRADVSGAGDAVAGRREGGDHPPGQTLTVIEKRPDGGWGVVSLHDYPVQETKLRGLLTGLTELRLAEARTSDPAEFARLGVDDPKAEGLHGRSAAGVGRERQTAGGAYRRAPPGTRPGERAGRGLCAAAR